MAYPIDALAEGFIFFVQDEISLLQFRLLAPKAPQVQRPALAEEREERQHGEQGGKDVKEPAPRRLG